MIDMDYFQPFFGDIPTENRNNAGFVYFIKNKQLSLIKIGYSKNPTKRIRDIENMSGCDIDVLLLIPCVLYKELEKELHDLFSNDRHRIGEWFNPSNKIKDFININSLDFGDICG